jgi:hypothetical protein
MATHATTKYKLEVFWDDEYKKLDYINEQFNDVESTNLWTTQGYSCKFTGDMCDMRSVQPRWNNKFIEHFSQLGWKDIGTSYYCMHTGTILPTHSDLYKKYIELFDLAGREQTIRRALILLEDWKSGHYLEVMGVPEVDWKAGTVIEWTYDTPHMAANIGLDPRYTLQITGHIDA